MSVQGLCEKYLDGQGGNDGLGVDQAGVAQVVQACNATKPLSIFTTASQGNLINPEAVNQELAIVRPPQNCMILFPFCSDQPAYAFVYISLQCCDV